MVASYCWANKLEVYGSVDVCSLQNAKAESLEVILDRADL